MLLRGRDGSELELDVLGYQFPNVEADPWDSNSLLVALRVVSAQGTWEAVDPCLTTWEAARLCRWLALLSAGDASAVRQEFNEPNVRVSVNGLAPDFSRARVHACFELETRPPWLPGPAAGRPPFVRLGVRASHLGASHACAECFGPLPRMCRACRLPNICRAWLRWRSASPLSVR